MSDPAEKPPTPPSGTFELPHAIPAQPAPPYAFGSGGLDGKAKVIGITTWMMIGMALVLAGSFVAYQFVKEDRADYRRQIQGQIESLEKAHERCEQAAQAERARQHEERQTAARERQQAADERQRTADERKATAAYLAQLIGVLKKLDAKMDNCPPLSRGGSR